MSTFETVTELIQDICDTAELGVILPESRLIEDLNISSLETLNLFSDIEDEFGIRISSQESRLIRTVSDLVDLIEEKR